MTVDRRIRGYFNFIRRQQWHPRTLLDGFVPAAHDKDGVDYKHMVRFCKLGATNEGDAFTIAAHADKVPSIAQDPYWRIFAPYWIRDEAQHAEAYLRLLTAFGEVSQDAWAELLLADAAEKTAHRENYYADCPAFTDRVHFWSAIAIDEWNTAREYAAAAKTTFRVAGPKPGEVQAKLAADEVQHHEYAVGALASIGVSQPKLRHYIERALAAIVVWANANGQPSGNTDQFMFDQEPVPRSNFTGPDFQGAATETLRKCRKAWGMI
jgi:hypothetical protein